MKRPQHSTALLRVWTSFTLAAITAVLLGCSEKTPDSYPAKDIQLVIPYSPGGGFDVYIRALIPYIEQHLPNDVNVIPVNAAGAGGQRGASMVYRAEPDGYTIGVFNLPGVLIPMLKGGKAGYDLLDVTWLATLSSDPYAIVVRKDSSIGSMEDLSELGRPVRYGATGPSSTSYIATTLVSNALGIHYEVVTGYKGSTDYLVGVMRGEIDAAFANLSTATPYLDSGEIRMIAVIGTHSKDAAIPDASALGISEFEKVGVIRMIGAPPGLPSDVQSILENAVLSAVADSGFQQWLKQTGNDALLTGADQTAATVSAMKRFYEGFAAEL